MLSSLSFFFLILFFYSATPFAVVGYLPEYRYGAITDWSSLSSHLTHLILFSIEVTPTPGGGVTLTEMERLPATDVLNKIREATQAHGTRLMVCVGGAGRSGGFAEAVQSPSMRSKFVENVVKLLKSKNLDGVDINWEQPQSPTEWTNLFLFISELRKALSPLQKQITMSIHPGQESRLTPEVIEDLDLIHLMAYDNRERHSTFQFCVDALTRLRRVVSPISKITLGIPFYGRHIYNGAAETYADLYKKHSKNLKKNSDEINNYFFNGVSLVKRKTKYAAKQGLGGVMVWELGQDLPLTESGSLLKAIKESLATETKEEL